MKRILLLTLCLLLAGAALSEDLTEAELDEPVWMSSNRMDDFYFHAAKGCRLATGEEGWHARVFAELMKKSPCPVCWEDGEKYLGIDGVEGEPLECFERGGTLVIRISDWAIAARMSGASEPGQVPEALLYENDRQDDDIARLVHGDAYVDWVNHALPGTEQALTAYIPDLDADRTDALLMSRRHIGAAWVLVVRPNDKERASLKKEEYYHLPMVFYKADLRVSTYDAGSLIAQGDGSRRWAGDVGLLPQKSAGEVVASRDESFSGDYSVYVVKDGGINTAVFRKPNYRESDLGNWFQYCGQMTRLTGYVDRKDVVCICALADGEVRALEEMMGFDLYAPLSEESGEAAEADDGRAPVSRITQPDGTVAAMDQPEYPVGAGFVSYTLTRPEGGIAFYDDHIPLERLEDGQWKEMGTLSAYADGDPERAHQGTFCDHVSLTLPLEKTGALEEGLYRLRVRMDYGDDGTRHSYLEFRVAADAPAPTLPEKREFGNGFLMVFDHTPPSADAATYNSCADTTRVYEGGARTRLLAGDTVFELVGVDESWGWGICSSYNLFAYPEGHPEEARQLLANFDHTEVTLYDLGDGLLLCDDWGSLWRCDYNGGNLKQLYQAEDGYIGDLVPVAGGVYIIRPGGVWRAEPDGFEPRQVYDTYHGNQNNTLGGGYAVYAEGRLVLADKLGIFTLDTLHPNADGTLTADYLTNEYDSDSGENGLGYIVLNGRLYYWSEKRGAMVSMKLDGTDIREVSKERYWFHSVTPDGCVLALSGSEDGLWGDERTKAALYFPNDPEHPAFDPDHSEKHAIDPDSFDFVLGDWYYHRDADGNETRVKLEEVERE